MFTEKVLHAEIVKDRIDRLQRCENPQCRAIVKVDELQATTDFMSSGLLVCKDCR